MESAAKFYTLQQLLNDDAAIRAAFRLKSITGFVTVYGSEADPRQEVFARFWHVRRVAKLAWHLARSRPGTSFARTAELAWQHDMNRWPFAHNSELGRFSQVDNSWKYFAGLAKTNVNDIAGIQAKVLSELTPDGRCVLVADAVVGMIEDPLLLITALRVRPDYLPRELAKLVGFEFESDPWRSRSLRMADTFKRGASPATVSEFMDTFDTLLMEQCLILLHGYDITGCGADERLLGLASEAKQVCHFPKIFPINNDLVCRGHWLRQEVMPRYCERFTVEDLVYIDENEFVERMTSAADSMFVKSDFRPDLDVIEREYPELAFSD